MTLQPRDRRALAWLGVSALLSLVVYLWMSLGPGSSEAAAPVASDSVPTQEQRLARLRDIAATTPGKEEILKKVSADLAVREKGLIRADSLQQAQAQLVTILRKIADGQSPSVDIRSTEPGPVDVLENSYGAINASVNFECSIDQLMKLMGSIAARPELLATRDLRILSADAKNKTLSVRLTVTGIVPKSLVPAKKGTP
jgi:hypothetical protein